MSERYLITGVQLGMLIAIPEQKDRQKTVHKIQDEQWLGHSNQDVKKDAKKLAW